MKAIQVEPLRSIDGIKFGSSRASVRKACGDGFREFKKSRFSKNTSDDYGTYHVYYDSSDQMVAVEFFDGAKVAVGKTIVFPADIKVALKAFPDLKAEGDFYTSLSNSVSIGCSEGKMDSIIIAEKGYFG